MAINPEITVLIERLNQELEETEQYATRGLNLVRQALDIFTDNATLVAYFAYFNNVLFFVETSIKRIQTTLDTISADDVTDEEIQEAGEDLGEQLGRVLEAKIGVRRIISILEE